MRPALRTNILPAAKHFWQISNSLPLGRSMRNNAFATAGFLVLTAASFVLRCSSVLAFAIA